MKRLGVKNRCRVFQIPPNISYIKAPPRMQMYIDYAAEIYGIYHKYISKDDIHMYSIDEAFMDVTDYLSLYQRTLWDHRPLTDFGMIGNGTVKRLASLGIYTMPFDALSGLKAAIAAKEKVVVDKIELSEEMAAVLDDKMHQILKGYMICVTFYCNGEYVKKTGLVARLDPTARILQVVDVRIRFDDILDVEVVG